MKYLIILILQTFVILPCAFSQNSTPAVSLNGMYVSKPGSTADGKIALYTYMRFYKDGSIYLNTVNSLDPQAVSKWFGKYKKFSQKGSYQLNGDALSIQLNNKGSKDVQLEGLQETVFKGHINQNNQLQLTRDNEQQTLSFDFYPVADTTRFKYTPYKPELRIPGEWKVKQVLQGSRQVFFTNEDSTIIAISVIQADAFPFFKKDQNEFETTTAYYEWDADYMKNEQKMDVKKIKEDQQQAFIIWYSKDQHNDNYFLFARDKELLYNIMIYDTQMPTDTKLKLLESLYEINKQP